MPFAEIAGTRIHYRFDGLPVAPLLVLSNSLGTDLTMWDPQIETLARDFRVLRYDTRGHGLSAVTPGPYTIDILASDVVALLDHLAVERAAFCGLSLGGMTGMWLGVNAPKRFSRLVLANTAAQIVPPDRYNTRIEQVKAGGMASVSETVLGGWFTPAFRAREPATIAMMKAMIESTPAQGYMGCCAAIRDMDQREAIARIATPTLVIIGQHDGATPPADGRFLAAQIPGARSVELPAAHLSNVEVPPAFTAALLSFLKS